LIWKVQQQAANVWRAEPVRESFRRRARWDDSPVS
jgi:hypothetical protein